MTLKLELSALALAFAASGAFAQTVVGVSWSNFQEERWKTDEAAIKAPWKSPAPSTSAPTPAARRRSSSATSTA